jgi:hypothetical protein
VSLAERCSGGIHEEQERPIRANGYDAAHVCLRWFDRSQERANFSTRVDPGNECAFRRTRALWRHWNAAHWIPTLAVQEEIADQTIFELARERRGAGHLYKTQNIRSTYLSEMYITSFSCECP